MDRFGYSQQPAWISASTEQMEVRERAFFRSVYGWMFTGLMLTALAALAVTQVPAMRQLILGTGLYFVLFLVELGLVFYLSMRITKMSTGAAAFSFLAYSLLNGLTLSAIFFIYTHATIFNAFFGAAVMFGAMAVYGAVTKRDLTSWGSFFMMGLLGIVVMSLINFFLHSPAIHWAVSFIGVFIFLGLTAYDNQKLKSYAHAGTGTMQGNLAIYGALALYLDFINLFLMLLRLFGDRRR